MFTIPLGFIIPNPERFQLSDPIRFASILILGILVCVAFTVKRTEGDFPLSQTQTSQMRGIAILLVLFHHFFSNVVDYSASVRNIVLNQGQIGVSIFLILSGFGIYKSINRNGLKAFFSKRASRVLIPYIVAGLVQSIFELILYRKNFYLFIQSILNILYDTSSRWFIGFIIFWYCVVYLIASLELTQQQKNIGLFFFSIWILVIPEISQDWKICTFSFPLGYQIGQLESTYLKDLKSLYRKPIQYQLCIVPAFWFGAMLLNRASNFSYQQGLVVHLSLLGIISLTVIIRNSIQLFKNKIKAEEYANRLALFVFILLIMFVYFSWTYQGNIAGDPNLAGNLLRSLSILMASFSFMTLISVFLQINIYSRFLLFIGFISFEIYLLHDFLMYNFDFLFFLNNIYLSFLIYFGTVCISCILLKRIVKYLSLKISSKFSF